MNVIQKCCFRSMRENRKRTAVTVVGIILSTALITGVACLAVSFRVSMIAYEKERSGDYHYLFSGVKEEYLKIFENNQNLKKIGLAGEIGYAVLEGSQNPDKPYLYISAADRSGMEAMALRLSEGRLPENDSEVAISRHIRSNGLVDLKVGDTLSLSVGSRMSDGFELGQNNRFTYQEERLVTAEEKTYTIVGIVERPSFAVEDRMAPGYSVFTLLEEGTEVRSVNVFASYTGWGLRHAHQVNAGILGVSEDLYQRYYFETVYQNWTAEEEERITEVARDVREHYWLLKWELLNFSNGTANMLYAMAVLAVLIIVVTSVFCIRNSFNISLTEKMKLYGRLASVGTTSRQQKKMVYCEAVFLSLTGIPLGILSGGLASVILVKAVGGMVEDAVSVPLIFGTNAWAIAAAVLLSAVTIFFSARKSAKRAAKISPISAIRGNESVKISSRELRCPRLVDALFGVGGRIAYKNLRRARTRYRTTVVSIAVSVAVFVGLSTFTRLVAFASGFYYDSRSYQIRVTLDKENTYERALWAAGLEGVSAAEVERSYPLWAQGTSIPFTEDYKNIFEVGEREPVELMTLGPDGYAAFCKRLGVSVEAAKDKAIVIAEFEDTKFNEEEGRLYTQSGRIAQYRTGDVIEGAASEDTLRLEVLLQTDKKPMCMEDVICNFVVCIVSDEWFNERKELFGESEQSATVYLRCEDAPALEQELRLGLLSNYSLSNFDAQYRADKAMYTVLFIFLYGFITVVALIGITNIFNTITTNMELRAPEFAMLCSVGMTGGEFRRMVCLEGVFYGGKALLAGIPLGILFSLGFYRALEARIITSYEIPWAGIGLSAAAVALLLFGIMRYSLEKARRRNIIETIQNENI